MCIDTLWLRYTSIHYVQSRLSTKLTHITHQAYHWKISMCPSIGSIWNWCFLVIGDLILLYKSKNFTKFPCCILDMISIITDIAVIFSQQCSTIEDDYPSTSRKISGYWSPTHSCNLPPSKLNTFKLTQLFPFTSFSY